ncbi:hypothetical protein HanPI659440_Chr15g0585241 [Helianthus annuus]|nr:hypothetical protein HanPI659440_Chr15g0585241 [Helianthus annuus]
MNPAWGTPSTAKSKYINTRLSPSWAESPTPSNKTYTIKDLATDLYGNPLPPVASHASLQTAFVTSTNLYGNPIQVPVKPAPTTHLYGNPLPPVASQRHRSTVAPSSLDPRNCSQTKMAFYAKIVKDASYGESSRNDDSSEHDSSSVEDVSTSVEEVTTQVQATMDLNVNHQGRLLILMQIGQHLRVIPVRYVSMNQNLIVVIDRIGVLD